MESAEILAPIWVVVDVDRWIATDAAVVFDVVRRWYGAAVAAVEVLLGFERQNNCQSHVKRSLSNLVWRRLVLKTSAGAASSAAAFVDLAAVERRSVAVIATHSYFVAAVSKNVDMADDAGRRSAAAMPKQFYFVCGFISYSWFGCWWTTFSCCDAETILFCCAWISFCRFGCWRTTFSCCDCVWVVVYFQCCLCGIMTDHWEAETNKFLIHLQC